MTAKEKAKVLVSKFKFYQLPEDKRIIIDNSKQCALICVDEKIKEYTFIHDEVLIEKFNSHEVIGIVYRKYEFWIKVKQEINKL
jgi:hypothetical protein